ncbi:hypothetical protein C8A00DRAFT_38878 [Chaetomidium leptoderma]|uniref:Uncharacterized protein n=1 Tax=Chaetomidium leptoderma TaxID=669021 RepID=A0AAN6VBV6_9PEZI|nr:hypothetical protein C8A00DRAFT_38878 [Chaetomidium leptoderma]
MGVGRRNAHKKRHAHRHDRKERTRRHGNMPVARPDHSVLRNLIPKAGMIYPFDHTLMRSDQSDIGVSTAVRQGLDVPKFSTAMLDRVFSRIFEEATKVLQQTGSHVFTNDPIAYMRILRARPSLQDIWMRRRVDMLATLFLILPRAIDAFLEVDTLNWSGLDGVSWLVSGGMDIIKPDEEENAAREEQEAENLESDSDDGLFVKQTYSIEMDETNKMDVSDTEEMDGKQALSTDAPAAKEFQLSLEQVVEGMRRLHIDIDETALTEAFAKLRIGDAARPAPRKNGNPFLDDSEDDEIL